MIKKPRSNHQQKVRIISFSCVVDLGRPWVGGDDDIFNFKKHKNHQSNVYAQIICSCVHCQNDWCNCIWNQTTVCCQNFLICVQTNCNSSVWVLGCRNSGFLLFWMVCIGDAPVPDFDIETEQLYFLNYICSNVINPRANIIHTTLFFNSQQQWVLVCDLCVSEWRVICLPNRNDDPGAFAKLSQCLNMLATFVSIVSLSLSPADKQIWTIKPKTRQSFVHLFVFVNGNYLDGGKNVAFVV